MERLFERDLSWLSFNHRVLQEAQDARVPLMERLKFLAIYSSNLDEFYRVRVASYHHIIKKGGKDSGWAEELVNKITNVTDAQQRLFGKIFREEIVPGLASHGIHLLDNCETLNEDQLRELKKQFETIIWPHVELQPLSECTDEFLHDKTVYFVIRSVGEEINYHICRVPVKECGRFVNIPDESRKAIMQLDDLIRWMLPAYLNNAHDVYAIKVSRDAELYLEDEFEGDIVARIEKSLSKRQTGSLSRLLFQDNMPAELQKLLRKSIGLKRRNMIPGGRYHNFNEFFAFPDPGLAELNYESLPSLQHHRLQNSTVSREIHDQDLLLEFPYHDYQPVIDFISDAVADPCTNQILITLYRVASDSAVCKQLIEAAKKGIRVVVFDEVKARFDEESNIYWGKELEKSGAKVIYSFDHLKVHTKLLQVRKEQDGKVTRETYLGTGNFNEKTSRIYGDFALLTVDEQLGEEVERLFDFLEGNNANPEFEKLLVAPFTLRDRLCDLIDQEIEHAQAGKDAAISLKMNSLEDPKMIRKLYEASNAGVRIRLIVRGICCLVPGVEGLSKNIEAISIVDRYLEHARIFRFGTPEREQLYMASADWMRRNLNRRVEVGFPINDDRIASRVRSIFELQWSDNTKARLLDAEQQNIYKSTDSSSVRAQYDQYKELVDRGDQVM